MTKFDVLDIEQVIYLHERIIAAAGGKQGIRDFALLHSALERCKVTYGGRELYPTLLHKAAALLHSMVMNHAFDDGNKRTAYAIMSRFLNHNGVRIDATQEDVVIICVAVDNEGLKVKEIVEWLHKHTKAR
jgi:death-on-curing protein